MKYIRMGVFALLFSVSVGRSATIETVSIESKKMGRSIPATVVLPDSYHAGRQRYPVLYLLHGANNNHTDWVKRTDVEQLADEYDLIIFCPDGGKTSWYFDSPIQASYQYETFVAREAVDYLDQAYRTKASRQHRAISGNSMGGHGSLFLASRNRDVFSVAVPLSGGVDIRPFPTKWKISSRIGTIETHPENWEEYTVINQVKVLKDGDLAISIDCGSEDFFIQVNRALHEQLKADGIEHVYTEKPGRHNWDYWNGAIKRQMPFIQKHLK